MKKFSTLFSIIIFLFTLAPAAMAEGGIPTVTIASQTADQGSTFYVPVTGSDFTNVYGATFNINYDGALLTYNGFSMGAMGGQGTLNVTPGVNSVVVEWADELVPLNIVEDTVLLSLNFSLIPNSMVAADIDFAASELRNFGGTIVEGVNFVSGTVTPLSSLKEITAFSFPEGVGVIDGSDISVTVPFGTDVTALVPTIEFVGQSLEPASGVAQNFTEPQFYTVTSEDLASSGYLVTVTVADPLPSNIATITSGTFTVSAGGTANETITNVPFGTSKNDFLLLLRPSEPNQTSDAAGIADPVVTGNTLVVTAQDGVTVVTYTVTVNPAPVVPAEPVVTGGGGGGGFRVRNEEATSSNEDIELLSSEVVEPFADIEDSWAAPYIEELRLKGLIVGKSEGAFDPNSSLTRAELVQMVVNLYGIEVSDSVSEKPFSDVEAGQWYAIYIAAAKKAGIVDGYGDGTFKPDQQVSRVEALKILLEASKKDLAAEVSAFSDIDSGAWYAKYVNYAKAQGIVEGYANGTFGPGNSVTRGEFAKFMAMVL